MPRIALFRALLGLLALCLALNAGAAHAEEPQEDQEEQKLTEPAARQGYYIAIQAGAFSPIDRDSEVGWLGPAFGYSVALRLGERLTDWFDLGINLNWNYATNSDYVFRGGGLLLEGQLYPTERFFTRLALGFSASDVTRKAGRGLDKVIGRAGDYYALTVGYHLFPTTRKSGSGGFSFAPILQVGIGPGSDYMSTQVIVGIEGAFWTGLPERQLVRSF